MDRLQKSQIRNLILVLSSALLTAIAVAGLLLYNYGPSYLRIPQGTLAETSTP